MEKKKLRHKSFSSVTLHVQLCGKEWKKFLSFTHILTREGAQEIEEEEEEKKKKREREYFILFYLFILII